MILDVDRCRSMMMSPRVCQETPDTVSGDSGPCTHTHTTLCSRSEMISSPDTGHDHVCCIHNCTPPHPPPPAPRTPSHTCPLPPDTCPSSPAPSAPGLRWRHSSWRRCGSLHCTSSPPHDSDSAGGCPCCWATGLGSPEICNTM